MKSDKPGIVVYSVDGYEGVTEETIGSVDFKKNHMISRVLSQKSLLQPQILHISLLQVRTGH